MKIRPGNHEWYQLLMAVNMRKAMNSSSANGVVRPYGEAYQSRPDRYGFKDFTIMPFIAGEVPFLTSKKSLFTTRIAAKRILFLDARLMRLLEHVNFLNGMLRLTQIVRQLLCNIMNDVPACGCRIWKSVIHGWRMKLSAGLVVK